MQLVNISAAFIVEFSDVNILGTCERFCSFYCEINQFSPVIWYPGVAKRRGYQITRVSNHQVKRYPGNTIVHKFKASTNPLSQFVTKYTMDCDVDEDWRSAEEVNYMARNNFTVVRRTCINFAQTPRMNVDTFNKFVFGEFLPSETPIVYFRDWRRTGACSSVQIPHCQQNYHHEQMLPNKRVAAKGLGRRLCCHVLAW